MNEKIKPIHKFNNGNLATLCNKCRVIITEKLIEDLYCEKCKKEKNENATINSSHDDYIIS